MQDSAVIASFWWEIVDVKGNYVKRFRSPPLQGHRDSKLEWALSQCASIHYFNNHKVKISLDNKVAAELLL